MSRSQNDAISERRLRPIYDWLDNGNNKKALQEADKVLKKQSNFQCCRALKGLSLLRLGRDKEAIIILEALLAECPIDEGALNAMTLSYRELKMPDKICTLYENATKQEPDNEEFLSHLFMSYVRLGNLKKQQTTAMNLYKAKKKNPYYFWSVMSIVLQAVEGDQKLGQAITLPLAQKMVEKMEADGKMEQDQETIIYLLILELRNNWKGALDLLNGPLGKKLENSASYHLICLTKRIDLEGRLENWSEVARLSRNVLLQQPDSWDMFNNYIQAVIKLQESFASNGGDNKDDGPYSMKLNKIDRSVVEAESLMNCLSSGFPGLRGPALAKLELCYRTLDGRSTRLQELIIEYIDLFGGKPVCFSDIKKYLKVIPVEERNDFILRLRSRYPDSGEIPTNTAQIYTEICVTGIERFLGQHLKISDERVDQLVSGLCDRYLATQPLVQHIVSTELRPSDGYLVLAGQLLWEKWINTKEKRFFLQACSMLRLGLLGSPSNWQLMLLLIRFVGRVGAGTLCDEIHTPLDVKNLMLDTLSWVLLRPLAAAGQVDRLHRIYCQMIRFYHHSPKETTEHIIQAYKHGNLSQICDISKLKRRLLTSYYVPLVNTDKLLIDINFLAKTYEEVLEHIEYANLTPVNWDSLADNRDFRTILSYEPDESAFTEDMVAANFQLEMMYSRIRRVILQTLVTCLQPGATDGETKTSATIKTLGELRDKLTGLQTEAISLVDKEIFLDYPQAPYRSQLLLLLPSRQIEGVMEALKLTQTVMQQATQEKCTLSDTDLQPMLKYLDQVKSAVDESVDLSDWTCISGILESNQYRIEIFSILVLCTSFILSFLRGGKTAGKKGKKVVISAKFTSIEPKFKELTDKLGALGDGLKSTLDSIYKKLEDEMLSAEVASLKLTDPSEQEYLGREKTNLMQKIQESYASQKQQMDTALASKRNILESIAL